MLRLQGYHSELKACQTIQHAVYTEAAFSSENKSSPLLDQLYKKC